MKRNHFTASATLLFVLAISACTKSKQGSYIPPQLSARINNEAWVADTFYARYGGSFFIIDGRKFVGTSSTEISIGISDFNGTPGVYVIGVKASAEYYDYVMSAYHMVSAGSVSVSKCTADSIQGTFVLKADKYNITNGQFNARIH